MKDEQAYLDFAYLANAQVALVAPNSSSRSTTESLLAYSYLPDAQTGGREGMILSQRYPTVFNGIISGDPAMRTGLSNLPSANGCRSPFNQLSKRHKLASRL